MSYAALIPIAYDMLRPKPGAPSFNMPNRPDRSAYIDMILRNGFETNSPLYQLAMQRVASQINQDLVSRGIMGSAAEQLRAGGAVSMSNKILEDQLRRQIQAMGVVNQYDSGVFTGGLEAERARNENAWGATDMAEGRGQGFVKNIGGLVDVWERERERADMTSRLDRWENESNRRFDSLTRLNGSQANSGGMYYGMPDNSDWRSTYNSGYFGRL